MDIGGNAVEHAVAGITLFAADVRFDLGGESAFGLAEFRYVNHIRRRRDLPVQYILGDPLCPAKGQVLNTVGVGHHEAGVAENAHSLGILDRDFSDGKISDLIKPIEPGQFVIQECVVRFHQFRYAAVRREQVVDIGVRLTAKVLLQFIVVVTRVLRSIGRVRGDLRQVQPLVGEGPDKPAEARILNQFAGKLFCACLL